MNANKESQIRNPIGEEKEPGRQIASGSCVSLDRSSPLTQLKGVGEKTAQLYASAGIETIGDLLDYFPRDYDFYARPVTVSELCSGKSAAVELHILGSGRTVHSGRFQITGFHGADPTGEVRITYFNMPFMVRSLPAGSRRIFRGTVREYKNGSLQMGQPESFTPEEYAHLQDKYLPRYSLSGRMKNTSLMKLMQRALEECEPDPDPLPPKDREKMGLMGEWEATRKIHFPESAAERTAARNRKVFDEFLAFLFNVHRCSREDTALQNDHPLIPCAQTKRLIEELPYELTESQKLAWQEIEADLTGHRVMNRLLQGDVGSGKTILAFLALLLCASNGKQGALMAPTEVLARQHMKDLSEMAESHHLPIRPVLLIGSVAGKARTRVLEQVKDGSANVIIGTHALIQEKVEYRELALVITDEQHRFGVRQREALAGKGERTPVLVMSATPIPRTLSIILYGDLAVSRLTELPKNRLPVKNLALPASERGRMYRFILKEIEKGRQAYVICPAIEDNGLEQLENVTDYTELLRKSLPPAIRIESLNGKMRSAEKERIMTAFAAHDIDILVSTTVIEVGINVPNATCILIENAERFGLSQLHQLRGRVGRGSDQSYCMFLYSKDQKEKPKRLNILERTNDGFEIAEQDLKLRGPGDLFGVRQSGELGFRVADIYADAPLLAMASSYVEGMVRRNPEYRPQGIKSLDVRSI